LNEEHHAAMPEQLISSQAEFDDLCGHVRQCRVVAFDTEFVAEDYFRPRLCLLQFATPDRIAAVDPFDVPDLSSWWALMTDDVTTIIVHGGREEVRFCQHATGQLPQKLVDVQIAEGLLSRGYPLSYSSLAQRVLNVRIHSHETRTEWRRRPLTREQISYALDDVRHLPAIWEKQQNQLLKRGRLAWAEAEFERFMREATRERDGEAWRRVTGAGKLNRRGMAVFRELYTWRDKAASDRDRPARSVLRDDLLIEIARRQPKTTDDATSVRGMQRRDYIRLAPDLVACVKQALALPDEQLPEKAPTPPPVAQNEVLGKVLGIALAQRCAELGISTALVGTSADLQDLVRWDVADRKSGPPPRLMQGWREEVCGDLLSDVLEGKVALRIVDPNADAPLRFER
jgi:ribonuclease D